jgi:spore maturation protein CgeB
MLANDMTTHAPLRMLKASPCYPAFIRRAYRDNPSLADASYQEQYQTFMDGCFGWSDFWKLNLERYCGCMVEEVTINAELMQKRWAMEHEVSFRDERWQLDIIEAQIREFRPDIFFAHDFDAITPEFRKSIKMNYPFVKLIVGWNGIALHDTRRFEGVDLLLTCLKETVAFFEQHGFQAHLIHFGFEETLLELIGNVRESYPVTFVGGISLMSGGHYQRMALLSKLAKRIDLDLWLSGISAKNAAFMALKYLRNGDLSSFVKHIGVLPDYFRLAARSRGEMFGLDMYRTLMDSRVTLNTHIDLAGGKAANIRLFEATGVGTCLVTDWKENIRDLFVPDEEIVTYRSIDEAAEKISYLLEHENERKKIARAGQARTLRDYTFRQMVCSSKDVFDRLIGS